MCTNYPVIVCIMLVTSSEMKTLTNFQMCNDIFMSNLFISTFSVLCIRINVYGKAVQAYKHFRRT